MPKSELHKRKKAKNYAVFLSVIAFIVTIFAVTIIRMKGG